MLCVCSMLCEEREECNGSDVRNVAEGFLLALCGGPVLSMQVRWWMLCAKCYVCGE